MTAKDPGDDIFGLAYRFVNETDRNIFLTGKAGTGKTTFLKHVREGTGKKMIVVAPTGIAAINAGGQTIHSFFQLPFGMLPPGDHLRTSISKMQWGGSKRELMRHLELLVIDEVSMVRADLLDAIDQVLRFVRKKPNTPFGGVQVLFIGDLFQLSPIAKNEEWSALKDFYSSPFFFDAHVSAQIDLLNIELTRIYRQQDDGFIQLLNNVRNNCCTQQDFELLNSRIGVPAPTDNNPSITLTSHNNNADTINQSELDTLPGQVHFFEAKINGAFPEKSYPALKTLVVKEKAQVIFIKNDGKPERRYYNGKLAIIDSIRDGRILAHFANDEKIEIERETWSNTGFQYDKAKGLIEEEQLGTFSQFPIKLAWAITIHKSQGLSFERAVIDAAESFAPGQVYVALSRLTNLEGLTLRSRIGPAAISTDIRVLSFLKTLPAALALPRIDAEKHKMACRMLKDKFSFESLTSIMQMHALAYGESETKLQLQATAQKLGLFGETFCRQLDALFVAGVQDGFIGLVERIYAAVVFFKKELDDKMISPVQAELSSMPGDGRKNLYVESLATLIHSFSEQKEHFDTARNMAEALVAGKDAGDIIAMAGIPKAVVQVAPLKSKAHKGSSTQIQSLELLRKGLSVAQIGEKRHLSVAAVEQHLIACIAAGEVAIQELVSPEKLNKLIFHLTNNPAQSPAVVRQALGKQFTFSDIRAVMAYISGGREGKIQSPGAGGNLFAL